jgi:hypothetical protein
MLLLPGTLLQLLTRINLSAYKENLQPFAAVDFFQDVKYHYDAILEKIKLQTLHIRRHFDASFLLNVFTGSKYYLSVFEAVSIHAPTRNVRSFTTFSCFFSQCSSTRCVSTAAAVCKCTDVFDTSCLSVKSPG